MIKAFARGSTRDARIEATIAGEGPDVVLLPSAGRGAQDFALLQAALALAGYRSIAVNYRGAGNSSQPKDGLDFRDVAGDVAAVIGQLARGPAHVVGHALGNTVARATASYFPESVRTVATLPAGGHNLGAYPVDPEVLRHFPRCHDETLSPAEKLESLGIVFFAPGNDASAWLHGWYPEASAISRAMQRSDPEEWWRAGHAPILIVQPLQDAMLPRLAGRELALQFGDRAAYVEIPRCGHAILPEQPALVAANLTAFLQANS